MYIDYHRLMGLHLFSFGYFLICMEKFIHQCSISMRHVLNFWELHYMLIVSYMKDILMQLKASPLTTFTHKVSTIYDEFEDSFKLFFFVLVD